MKFKTFLPVVIFAFTPVLWAQNASAQAPASGGGSQARTERRENMMEMHKQQMEAMKACGKRWSATWSKCKSTWSPWDLA